ncbi:hypothetical protein [Myxococcus sp. Y35]|uniref:hypothetical protein n=1 Tax=Pseudomyxococcus flavus TaxID=3115648 RepID=UPI003CEF986A
MTTRRLFAVMPLALCLLLSPGCDKGPDQLRDAEASYRELIDRRVSPRDPAWDSVIAAFEAIPKDSKARPEAERHLAAIRGVRGKLPPRPLATPGATGPGTSEVDAKRAACEALAIRLGQTPEGPGREPLRQALAECRKELVKLEAHSHPPGEHGHDHGGELHPAPAEAQH